MSKLLINIHLNETDLNTKSPIFAEITNKIKTTFN